MAGPAERLDVGGGQWRTTIGEFDFVMHLARSGHPPSPLAVFAEGAFSENARPEGPPPGRVIEPMPFPLGSCLGILPLGLMLGTIAFRHQRSTQRVLAEAQLKMPIP